jgi:type III secretory pathway component EscS
LQVVGLIVSALSIAGISNAQLPFSQHLFIVILVLTLFMGAVSMANCILSKGYLQTF